MTDAPGAQAETGAETSQPAAARRVLHVPTVKFFSSASDAPRARRPTDAVLLVLAALFIGLMLLVAPGPTAIDKSLSQLVAELPGLFGWFWELSYDVLLGWAVVLLVAAVVAHERKRLLVEELLAGALAYGFAAVAGKIAGTDWASSLTSIGHSDPPAIFPAMRLAIAAAVIVAASPHLSRPLRYVGRWVVGIGAVAGIALGVALPLGVATAFAVAVGSAALVHLLLGSPGGRLTLDEMTVALRDLGVDVDDITYAPLEPRGVALALASTSDGQDLLVKVYGRDAWDGQLIASLWSTIWLRGESPRLGLSRREQIEHEAFLTLLAEREGIPVAPHVASGLTHDADAVLVLEQVGRPVAEAPPEDIDDDLLHGFWDITDRLLDAGIAHGHLDAHHLLIRPDGTPALSDFGDANVPAVPADLLADRAQLLVTTALLVGPDRALAAATAAIGGEGLGDVLPYLQPAVLDRETRHAVRAQDWKLDDLRKHAAEAAGIELPALEKVRRVTVGSILTVLLIALVAWVIISAIAQVGLQSLIDEFESADMVWFWAALLLSPFVQPAQGVSTVGASIRAVKLGPVIMLQYAIAFIALAVPSSAARVALEIRFFERVGVAATGAVAIGVIDSVCGFVIQMLLILTITLSGLASLDLSSASGSAPTFSGKLLIIAGVVLVLGIVVLLAVPKYRKIVRDKAADGKAALQVLRSPTHVGLIFIGNFTAQVLLAIILGLSLKAFGYHLSLAELILINTFVSLFAGFMPVPGGMGVAEAGLTAGLVAFGVPHTAAFSTAIMFRLVTYYLPPIWGGFAMKWLRTHSYV